VSQRNELRKVAEQRGLSYLVKHMLAIIAWTDGYDAALKAAREWPEPPAARGKPAPGRKKGARE
jgi:hypothetical protein